MKRTLIAAMIATALAAPAHAGHGAPGTFEHDIVLAANDQADAWRRWAEGTACDAEGRLDLYGLQALVMRAVVESGECFVRCLPTEVTPANPVGLRLQVLESDHLDAARNGIVEGLPTLQGIALGDAGQPVSYWLHRIHPGASWLVPGRTLASEPVPARRRGKGRRAAVQAELRSQQADHPDGRGLRARLRALDDQAAWLRRQDRVLGPRLRILHPDG